MEEGGALAGVNDHIGKFARLTFLIAHRLFCFFAARWALVGRWLGAVALSYYSLQ